MKCDTDGKVGSCCSLTRNTGSTRNINGGHTEVTKVWQRAQTERPRWYQVLFIFLRETLSFLAQGEIHPLIHPTIMMITIQWGRWGVACPAPTSPVLLSCPPPQCTQRRQRSAIWHCRPSMKAECGLSPISTIPNPRLNCISQGCPLNSPQINQIGPNASVECATRGSQAYDHIKIVFDIVIPCSPLCHPLYLFRANPHVTDIWDATAMPAPSQSHAVVVISSHCYSHNLIWSFLRLIGIYPGAVGLLT